MTASHYSVGIVGAGIAGLSAAIALRLAGHEVALFEAADTLEEIGAGLQLAPNGSRLLQRMGVNLDAAVTPDGVELRDGHSGRKIVFTPMAEAAEHRWGAPYLHIARTDLQLALLARARELGIEPQLGTRIDKPSALGHDFIVIADGVNSQLRDQWLGGARVNSGAIAYRAALPASLLANPPPKRAIIWRGNGAHAVTTRIGAHADKVNFVGVIDDPMGDLKAFDPFHRDIRAIIAQAGTIQRWPLFTREPRFAADHRVFIIGDAAHAMLPSAAQGAVMAIEDAVALVRALDQTNPTTAFTAMRQARVTRVAEISRQNMEQFHRRGPWRVIETIGARAINIFYPEFFYRRLDWLYGYDCDDDRTP